MQVKVEHLWLNSKANLKNHTRPVLDHFYYNKIGFGSFLQKNKTSFELDQFDKKSRLDGFYEIIHDMFSTVFQKVCWEEGWVDRWVDGC